jgi:hypothetical protein
MTLPALENYFPRVLRASPPLKTYFQVRVSVPECHAFLLDRAANSTTHEKNQGALTNLFLVVIVGILFLFNY